ncbi:hypothetical protein NQZ79_g1352 [Umbelopsis isabellina]|nr:hypothetical protein NQZ79_g1352 [Umbelopsis isabellina]
MLFTQFGGDGGEQQCGGGGSRFPSSLERGMASSGYNSGTVCSTSSLGVFCRHSQNTNKSVELALHIGGFRLGTFLFVNRSRYTGEGHNASRG